MISKTNSKISNQAYMLKRGRNQAEPKGTYNNPLNRNKNVITFKRMLFFVSKWQCNQIAMAHWVLQWNQKSNDSKRQEASRKLGISISPALQQEGKCGAQML
jgi:hypothetical protein